MYRGRSTTEASLTHIGHAWNARRPSALLRRRPSIVCACSIVLGFCYQIFLRTALLNWISFHRDLTTDFTETRLPIISEKAAFPSPRSLVASSVVYVLVPMSMKHIGSIAIA